MAHRAFFRVSKQMPYKASEMVLKKTSQKQDFRHLLVLDFEATCQEQREIPLSCTEIIEFPCVVLSTEDWQVKDVFHEYVKPRVNPNLTPFCTNLTGVLQEMIEKQPHFPEIFDNFNKWLKTGGYLDEDQKSVFITSGDWDLGVMLPNQCKLDGITKPNYFDEWIDLKKVFFKVKQQYPRGLKGMARELGLSFTGKLHSGINDVHNMVRFITKFHELHKTNFQITSSVHTLKNIKL